MPSGVATRIQCWPVKKRERRQHDPNIPSHIGCSQAGVPSQALAPLPEDDNKRHVPMTTTTKSCVARLSSQDQPTTVAANLVAKKVLETMSAELIPLCQGVVGLRWSKAQHAIRAATKVPRHRRNTPNPPALVPHPWRRTITLANDLRSDVQASRNACHALPHQLGARRHELTTPLKASRNV